MRTRRIDVDAGGEAPEFQVSAMVDILMTLLVFFVATATFESVGQPADLKLPLAARDLPDGPKTGEVVVQLERGAGRILVDRQTIEKPGDLVPLIRERIRLSRRLRGEASDFQVIIRADRDTPYRRVEEIMRAAGQAGAVDVLFALEKNEARSNP